MAVAARVGGHQVHDEAEELRGRIEAIEALPEAEKGAMLAELAEKSESRERDRRARKQRYMDARADWLAEYAERKRVEALAAGFAPVRADWDAVAPGCWRKREPDPACAEAGTPDPDGDPVLWGRTQ